MWRIYSLLSPDQGSKLDPDKGNLPETVNPYPGSLPAPKHSVTAQMVMDVLRDHYEGTAYDLTQGMAAGPFGSPNRGASAHGTPGLWERAISMHRTSWSYVLEARPPPTKAQTNGQRLKPSLHAVISLLRRRLPSGGFMLFRCLRSLV